MLVYDRRYYAENPLEMLASLVTRRRKFLRLTKQRAAASVGMSTITWTRVEDGRAVRSLTLDGVDRALHWPQGSCLAIESGDALDWTQEHWDLLGVGTIRVDEGDAVRNMGKLSGTAGFPAREDPDEFPVSITVSYPGDEDDLDVDEIRWSFPPNTPQHLKDAARAAAIAAANAVVNTQRNQG